MRLTKPLATDATKASMFVTLPGAIAANSATVSSGFSDSPSTQLSDCIETLLRDSQKLKAMLHEKVTANDQSCFSVDFTHLETKFWGVGFITFVHQLINLDGKRLQPRHRLQSVRTLGKHSRERRIIQLIEEHLRRNFDPILTCLKCCEPNGRVLQFPPTNPQPNPLRLQTLMSLIQSHKSSPQE